MLCAQMATNFHKTILSKDYQYFPYKNDSLVAVFIHLDDTNVENGGLAVYPGSHLLGPLEDKGTVSGEFRLCNASFVNFEF